MKNNLNLKIFAALIFIAALIYIYVPVTEDCKPEIQYVNVTEIVYINNTEYVNVTVPVEVIKEVEVVKEFCPATDINPITGCLPNHSLMQVKDIDSSFYIDFKNKVVPNAWYELWGGKPDKTYSDDNVRLAFNVANGTECYAFYDRGNESLALLKSMVGQELCSEVIGTEVRGTMWQTEDWGQVPDFGEIDCSVVYNFNLTQYMPELNLTEFVD